MEYTNRILVVDDDSSIHEAFTKILASDHGSHESLDAARAAFMGVPDKQPKRGSDKCELLHAHQGEEAVQAVKQAVAAGTPIDLAFVDVRMPPGMNGVETVRHIWQVAPMTEIVLCTAWSDYSHEETLQALGQNHRLLILKKPFESIEVRQMALALHEKRRAAEREAILIEDLQAASRETKSYAASLVTANRALSLSKKAMDHAARLKTQALEDLTLELRDLIETVMGQFLATNDPQEMEQAIKQAQDLLARAEEARGHSQA
ncbi:MAG: response regulator [bacterium]